MNTIKILTRYAIYTVLCAVFLTSCNESKTQKPSKKYIVQTTHDNNWTTSARIECDSVSMVSHNEVVLWVNGREMKMFAPMFKIFNNPDYGKSIDDVADFEKKKH